VKEVRGPGVVGAQPVLEPGMSYEYTSYCPLKTSVGTMQGSYTMVRPGGELFEARIAPFTLAAPNALH
jgi:ApaG protein